MGRRVRLWRSGAEMRSFKSWPSTQDGGSRRSRRDVPSLPPPTEDRSIWWVPIGLLLYFAFIGALILLVGTWP